MLNLAAYIPTDRRLALARGEDLPDRCAGAALFADISGFTPLTEQLTQELGPRRGAEALLGVLNPLFEALIAPVHRYGGSVIGFVGDAITCWFDEKEEGRGQKEEGRRENSSFILHPSAFSALAAALEMQAAMQPLAVVQMPGGAEITLSIKVAVAYGPARRFLVGDPALQQMDALAGATLARMAEAEHHAEPNEVVVSQEVAAKVGAGLVIREWRGDGRFAVVTGLSQTVAPAPQMTTEVDLPEDVARPWILPAVYAQLQAGTALLGDLRPTVPLMLRFGGLDYDGDDAVGEKLDAFVRWVQHVVHQYEGNLLQLTIGDKGAFMYAAFGAPIAHENDPARALWAALMLRALPPELAANLSAVQIGVTRGEVWTGNYGGNDRFTYGVIGSVVNLAARLMARAQPGEILVDGALGRLPGFHLAHVGDLRYKGFAEPLPTYRLLGMQAAGTQHFSFQTMVGRTAELEIVQQVAAKAAAGQAQAVFIYGEAGIGKSRLTAALQEKLARPGQWLWLTGQTDSILRRAFNPFTYLAQTYFLQHPEASAAENRARFEQRLHELTASALPEALRAELLRTASFLGALLNLQWDDSLYAQLTDAKLRHENTLTALRTFLLALSALQPLVVELEDGQWLDNASHEVLTQLTRQTTAYPILLLITARYADDGSMPQFPVEDWPVTRLELRHLPSDALRALVEQQLGAVDNELYAFLEARSQGVPFFAQQLALYVQETGAIELRAGEWRLRVATQEIPATLSTMLIARLDRLSAQVKQAVQTAAVLGREFDVRLLAQMLDDQCGRRADTWPEVSAAERGQVWNALTEIRYLFKHALLRDAAYDMQLHARLRDLHHLALTAYEQLYAADLSPHYDELAYHAERSGNEDKQREYFSKAGDAARAKYRNMAALDYYRRLLPLLLTPEEQIAIYLKQGQIMDLLGQWIEVESVYHTALSLAEQIQDAAAIASLQLVLGKLHGDRTNYVVALEWLERSRAGWTALGDQRRLGQTLVAIGRVYAWQANYVLAWRSLEEGLALARTVGDKADIAEAINNLGRAAYTQYDFAAARGFHEEGLILYRELGDKKGIVSSLCNLGNVANGLNEDALGWQFYEESLALSREIGYQRQVALLLGNMGWARVYNGDYLAARPLFEESLVVSRVTGMQGMTSLTIFNLGLSTYLQGDLTTARALLEGSLAEVRAQGAKQRIAATLTMLGRVVLSQGETALARTLIEEGMVWSRAIEVKWEIANALMGLGMVAAAEADLVTAQQFMAESLYLWQETSDKQGMASSLVGLAEFARSRADLRRAVRVAGAVDSLLAALNAKLDPERGLMNSVYTSLIATTRAALGETAFEAAWAEGAQMSLEEAVALALQEER